jgi:5-methylcytosine-specific restriction endonuclease McrA
LTLLWRERILALLVITKEREKKNMPRAHRTTKEKVRDLGIIYQAVIELFWPICTDCGYGLDYDNGSAFDAVLPDGTIEQFTEYDAQVDFAHCTSRDHDGEWKPSNLQGKHRKCNKAQDNRDVEVHVQRIKHSTMTAAEIRARAAASQQLGDAIMANEIINTDVLRVAKKRILRGKKNHRTGKEWYDKIMAA